MINIDMLGNAIALQWADNDWERVNTLLQGMWLLAFESEQFSIIEYIDFLQDIARMGCK